MSNKWLTLIAFASLIISIAAVAIAYFRCKPLTLDLAGVLVGALSLLVTLLVGWNIYYALDMKKELNQKVQDGRREWENEFKRHSILNQKEFENIRKTAERAEARYHQLDNTLLSFMNEVTKRIKK